MAKELQAALRHYVLILAGTWVALLALGILLGRYAGFSLPAAAVALFPPMVAALVSGRRIGTATGIVPRGPGAWRFAGFGALIYLGFQIVLAMSTFTALWRAGSGLDPAGLVFLAGMLCLLTAIVTLVNRLFLSVGARSVAARRR